MTIDWDFAQFVPDLIVVNLGTNDDSYTGDEADRQAEFGRQYVRFLEQVRSRSAQSDILCTLGIRGDRLYPHIEQAVHRYKEQTGDARVFLMKLDVQQAQDGSASGGHPSRKTHARAAETLIRTSKDYGVEKKSAPSWRKTRDGYQRFDGPQGYGTIQQSQQGGSQKGDGRVHDNEPDRRLFAVSDRVIPSFESLQASTGSPVWMISDRRRGGTKAWRPPAEPKRSFCKNGYTKRT
ncbi:SGNH/GDSL hydrolase family protein [Saccharibacillus deserti]|uniref:SGNH/GDSL hydrolase family protein n=1 Tax=Saccharibacillus deserti TaxID=1634444 RepID=UPI001FE4242F|nr:SGNH/GDSL hydrolase family protein [Saccharibacillus deserti]